MPGGIEGVQFHHRSYLDWLPRDAVIYCDPPYADTEKYREGFFDTQEFWALMEIWRQDNTVLVSEQKGACPLSGTEVLLDYPAGKERKRRDALYLL